MRTPPRALVVRSNSVPSGRATAHHRSGNGPTRASPTQSITSAV